MHKIFAYGNTIMKGNDNNLTTQNQCVENIQNMSICLVGWFAFGVFLRKNII